MPRSSSLILFTTVSLFAAALLAQTTAGLTTESLCVLQKKLGSGDHETVRVSGVYGPGLDHTVLEDPACPTEGTWIELDLRSDHNEEKLRRLVNRSRHAYVVVEGEFYGPPVPDPKLPEAIRRDYQPGWGHLSAFKTKLVVHVIRDVKPASKSLPR